MKSNSAMLLFGFLWITSLNYSEQTKHDNLDVTGNLSQWVNYSEILEEDKQYTLESLTTDKDETFSQNETETSKLDIETGNGTLLDDPERMGRIFPATNMATLGQFPYFVSLSITPKIGAVFICGGALISDTWVITAAQCVSTATAISVTSGNVDTTVTPPTRNVSPGIATVYPHYKKNYNIHDIALVRLQTPYTLSANIYPIKITKREKHGNELNAVTVRTMGFGAALNAGTPLSTTLNYIDLVQLSKATCNSLTAEIFVSYPPTTSCLSSSSSTLSFCLGDTGGPVVYTYPNELAPSLIGVLSAFQGCPSAYPMSYTRVAPYYHWIRSIVKKLL